MRLQCSPSKASWQHCQGLSAFPAVPDSPLHCQRMQRNSNPPWALLTLLPQNWLLKSSSFAWFMLDLVFAAMRRLITSSTDCGSWLVGLDGKVGVYFCAKIRHEGPLWQNLMHQKVFEVGKNVFEWFSASSVLIQTMFHTGFFSINNINFPRAWSKWFSKVRVEYLDSLGVKYLIFTSHISSLFSPLWFPFCNFCPSQLFHFVSAHCQRNSIEASSWGCSVINCGKNRSGWQNALEQKGFSFRFAFK